MENPQYFGYPQKIQIIFGYPWKIQECFGFPRKSELFWISMENPKYFGFSRKIQIILDIHRQSKYFGYPQTIHNIIGFPSWENHNIAQTIYSNKEIVLQQY